MMPVQVINRVIVYEIHVHQIVQASAAAILARMIVQVVAKKILAQHQIPLAIVKPTSANQTNLIVA
ncbi:MAG: hypothetical protein HZB37_07640 [Planctomycetes bacterium]|nr:hypothetical protein [Planctomycetota bacterium]